MYPKEGTAKYADYLLALVNLGNNLHKPKSCQTMAVTILLMIILAVSVSTIGIALVTRKQRYFQIIARDLESYVMWKHHHHHHHRQQEEEEQQVLERCF